jgi:hypothetical protein
LIGKFQIFLASLPAHAAIEWDFTPTAFVTCGSSFNGLPLCKLTGPPVASLILDGPDSTGNVSFNGFGPPPVITGDLFYFSLAGEARATGREHISSPPTARSRLATTASRFVPASFSNPRSRISPSPRPKNVVRIRPVASLQDFSTQSS